MLKPIENNVCGAVILGLAVITVWQPMIYLVTQPSTVMTHQSLSNQVIPWSR
ncbi:hypothetical protein [Shewanella phaeophyticola]|uniref:Uncharacterized protein n=1 Tax=Shewanella phaeophyticola TaxID=2978345 RepID=A0ABT2PA16_9GAMM|nr:hypothetical protein [Shewanella sp. KJ10-1]MCT8988466.1 hypothetical protein [Shewanella sp. KJ10-1]